MLAGQDSNLRWSNAHRVNSPDRSSSTATCQFKWTTVGIEPTTS